MSKLVAHPQTGEPVLEEVNYVSVERDQLDAKVASSQAELDEAQTALEAAQARFDKAEVALEDSKSDLSAFDEIKPQSANAGSEAASSEVSSADETGDSVDAASEQSGDSGEAESVTVEVKVEEVDEY